MFREQMIRQFQAQMRTMTGRDYRVNLEPLDTVSVTELVRLLRDLDYDKRSAVRRAKTMPWRR